MHPLTPETVLAFAATWRAEAIGPATLYLIGEQERRAISDARAVALAVHIDGQRSVREIVAAAEPRISHVEALYVLSHLLERGYLVPVKREAWSALATYWGANGFAAQAAVQALERAPVSVKSLGNDRLAEIMGKSLEDAGVRIDNPSRIRVIVTDDYLNPELEKINQESLRSGSPWFLLQPSGIQPLVGPFFHPGRGPCWKCLAFYMLNNRPVEELVRRHRPGQESAPPPRASLDITLELACRLGALAVARSLVAHAAGASDELSSAVLALSLKLLHTESHAVITRPQCPACGDPRLMADAATLPITLSPIEKTAEDDGGYRRQTPRQTYATIRHLVSPLTGAVTHLGPAPGRDTELRAVYASGYLVCPRHETLDSNQFDKGCFGKGRTADQAKMSALGEAIERFSGVFQGDEARLRASTDELGAQAVPLGALLNFSDQQYRNRQGEKGLSAESRPWVPEPLDRTTKIDWASGWSLSANQRRYVPFAYCYSEAPPESGTSYCRPCGNGVAAGTCMEEAVLQGLLELVERDATGIWWYNRLERPRLDLDSFGDPYINSLRADYDRFGWRIWVLDVTHDLGIPVCVALAHHERQARFSIGFGCHLERRLAVHRALTELNQLIEMDGSRKAPWDATLPLSQDFLFGSPSATVPMPTIERMGNEANLRDDIETCLRRLHQAGLEVVVVNKSRPDLGLNVAQVVVPGLRHFWPRFGPGRLYSVPCTLGWRSLPLSESELNPVPLLL